ncbi:hypothetical protein [Corticibacter populi]|uniref:hypothetical protein n=2 Tax=Corticibacter populi TaxID=1550736 RepID=UPI00102D1BD1|nr:hypothetical protein [Corticibacter populi]
MDDYMKVVVERTTPTQRESLLSLAGLPEPLQLLFEDYDLSPIHMLWTSFWSEPKKLAEGWGFADMSEVNIIMAPEGQIEAYNAHPIRAIHGASHFLGCLAKDLESYLEALLYGAFNAHHFISGDPEGGDPVLREKTILVAKNCALMAGGYEYYDFWAETLGLAPSEYVPE